MKNFIFLTSFLLGIVTYSQNTYYADVTASQIVSVMEKVGFVPIKLTTSSDAFEVAILSLNSADIKQLNITGWSECNNRKEENFRIYNIYYKDVTKTTFDLYCKELIALMICDGTISPSK